VGPQEIGLGESASRVCRDRINDARWKHIGHLIRARRTLASSFRSPYRAVWHSPPRGTRVAHRGPRLSVETIDDRAAHAATGGCV